MFFTIKQQLFVYIFILFHFREVGRILRLGGPKKISGAGLFSQEFFFNFQTEHLGFWGNLGSKDLKSQI